MRYQLRHAPRSYGPSARSPSRNATTLAPKRLKRPAQALSPCLLSSTISTKKPALCYQLLPATSGWQNCRGVQGIGFFTALIRGYELARYVGRAKNIYVVTYPKEGNVPHLKYQLERLEISGYRLKTSGLHLEYESRVGTLRIFVTPAQELRQNRWYQRAEFLLMSSSTSPYEGTETHDVLDSIIEELNSKLTGIQLESLADFTKRERGFKGELKDFGNTLMTFFTGRLFLGSLAITVALLVVALFTNQ